MNKILKFKKVYLISFGVIVVLLIFVILINIKNKKNEVIEKVVEKSAVVERKYGRLTFFNELPTRVSLAIPEDWEGKYRVEKGDKAVMFTYISNPEKNIPILRIRIHDKSTWNLNQNKKEVEIKTVDNQIFTYEVFKNEVSNKYKDEYSGMINDIPKIIESFKEFKLR